jgi:L-ascorbate metabolism protein UlaG (beta-lactamase superfamily)
VSAVRGHNSAASRWLAIATGLYAARRSMTGGPGHIGPVTDHFNGREFFNRAAGAGRSLGDFLRWQRTAARKAWPAWVENVATPELPASLAEGEIALTFVNHITYLVQWRGLNVLTDPVYSERVSPVQWSGPRRVRAPGLPFDDLPSIDLVLVSHNHYDHLDLDTLRRLEARHRPLFLTGLGNRRFLEQHGMTRVVELDWWQGTRHSGADIVFTPAQHWSGRGVRGRNRTLWGGFVVTADRRSVYFAGDTGYARHHFVAIRERCSPPDVSLLPIGAYEPRWFMREQHMNPDDAVRAHCDLDTPLSIATHFGCFQLTDEGIDDPVRDLAEARRVHGVDTASFRVLETGETLRVAR